LIPSFLHPYFSSIHVHDFSLIYIAIAFDSLDPLQFVLRYDDGTKCVFVYGKNKEENKDALIGKFCRKALELILQVIIFFLRKKLRKKNKKNKSLFGVNEPKKERVGQKNGE
jgi:hypothetical protein